MHIRIFYISIWCDQLICCHHVKDLGIMLYIYLITFNDFAVAFLVLIWSSGKDVVCHLTFHVMWNLCYAEQKL